MTYDFEKLVDGILSKSRQTEGVTEEKQNTIEYEKPTSTHLTAEQSSPIQVKRDKGHTEVNVSFPGVPIETNGQPVQINCYVDASVRVEQNNITHTTVRKDTAIGVGDDTIKSVMGAIAGLGGLLKGL